MLSPTTDTGIIAQNHFPFKIPVPVTGVVVSAVCFLKKQDIQTLGYGHRLVSHT